MNKVYLARTTTLVLYFAFLASFILWQWVRPQGASIGLLIIQSLPLLIFLPGLLKDNPRTHIGLCFVVLLYFIKGVEGVFHPARSWFDIALIVFSVSIFISSMLTSRWLQHTQFKTTGPEL